LQQIINILLLFWLLIKNTFMKHCIPLLLLVLMLAAMPLSAQVLPFEDNTEAIAKTESRRFSLRTPDVDSHTGSNINIIHTSFHWQIDPAVLYISGSVNHTFVALVDVQEITLELNDNMVIDSIIYHAEPVAHEYLSDYLFKIILPEALPAGATDSVKIYYQGAPQQGQGFGAFAQDYHNEVPIIWTLSEPYGAKEWWPGKNDLTDKIDSTDIFVTTPDGYSVASNGLLVSEISADGFTTFHWRHRYPIASYLLAIAVTNYARFEKYAISAGDTLPIINYFYPEDSAVAVEHSANTDQMIRIYDSLFGRYPFANEKYGHAQFSWPGGMEHQTMSFMGGFGHDLRAHELAHSWFGNKITLGTWQHVFLNEGFATYATGLTFEEMYDGYYWDIWKSNTINSVISNPGGSVFVEDTADISRLFNARLSYYKGAMLLHMLRWKMGDDPFFDALRSYVADPMLAYRFATLQDFIYHLEMAGDYDFTEFFDDWYYGEGWPRYGINVTQLDDGKIKITIDQQQSHPSVDFFEMPVPVVVRGADADSIVYRCDLQFSGQEFIFDNPGFEMISAGFDPNRWLLASLDYLSLSADEPITKAINIYPNPATEAVQIFVPNLKIEKITITNAAGKKVFDENYNLTNEMIAVDVSAWQPGVYFVIIKTNQLTVHGKIVTSR
jgi:aminopeptidase N